uniref:J domain-containing protein n=1 Tax=Globisporangium ultimum (strain ATCC 200006 / CBS 805.95 / DAOM BR144) TaxID=431595 RepID=K3WQB2_GLOUD
MYAAVLCAAIASAGKSKNDDQRNTEDDGDRATSGLIHERRVLETHIRNSPLPHDLQFPVIEFQRDYVLMETTRSIVCAVRATTHRDILETVLSSTMPLSDPYEYRFGGAHIHVPFWKRAQRLDLQAIYRRAKRTKKMLFLCGHSIGGSIAQLGFCELVYQHLPLKIRLQLEKMDFEQKKQDKAVSDDKNGASPAPAKNAAMPAVTKRDAMLKLLEAYPDQDALLQTLPNVLAVGFGAPYSSSQSLSAFLEPFGMLKRMVTFVNEFDCIPGILNIAQSAAMLTKTAERLVTITKATKTLLNLLPARMQHVLAGLSSTNGTGTVPSATSAYITMSLNILQNSFQKLRDYNVVKDMTFQYAPCGMYVFLKKNGSEYQKYADPQQIMDALHADSDATTTLTGNSILQHLMSAYVDAIAKRSTSIQINATMNYYERLSIPRNATQREIRSAYRTLALKWHPDRWAHATSSIQEKEMAEQIFKLLAESYEVLSDPVARKEYDAHLAKAPNLAEEFVRSGTVNGMTLDEAIATFRDMFDRGSGMISRATSRFSSSSSSVVGQQNIRRGAASSQSSDGAGGLIANNHDNLFAPDRIRVARKVGIGANQQDKIMYLHPDELIPGDIPAPSRSIKAPQSGLKTISVVGGAVAVGASVALIVSAWSQFSESSKRRRQAETVRNMPGDHLMLLMEDHINTRRATKSKMLQLKANKESTSSVSATIPEESTALVTRDSVDTDIERVVQQEEESDMELIDEFYECVTEYDAAALEAFAEDEFFDCVDLAEAIKEHFHDQKAEENHSEPEPETVLVFPEGSRVNTPFGIGVVESWRDHSSSAVIRFSNSLCVGYIQKSDLTRGASIALAETSKALEIKRVALAERVIADYHLEDDTTASNFRAIVHASKDGALDSGIRAAGGVALAKGIARTSKSLGGAVAAPLTIASILVDIGKEYYDYRTKHTERKSQGVLSESSERLLMRDFRLKAGQHIASGTAAAAGASVGAYSVASAVGFWTGVGITGPVGVIAATSAAVVGGMLGFFAGSKAYNGYTSTYFHSHKHAKEHIDRLELGARILFNEYDPESNGEIAKDDCIKIMTKLYEASSAVSEDGYQQTVDVLQDASFQGPVTWSMFWEWVSTEAAKSLRVLEHEEAKPLSEPVQGESWWSSYMSYFSYGSLNSAVTSPPELASPQSCMYPSVKTVLRYKNVPEDEAKKQEANLITAANGDDEVEGEDDEDRDNLVVLHAQLEALVNSGDLTVGDAFQLKESLDSEDAVERESAQKTIVTLQNGQADSGELDGVISEGFFGTSAADSSASSSVSDQLVTRPRKAAQQKDEVKEKDTNKASTPPAVVQPRVSKEEEEMDVLCSLMSTQGLRDFLQAHHIEPTADSARHEDLHCLALQVTVASTAPSRTSSTP